MLPSIADCWFRKWCRHFDDNYVHVQKRLSGLKSCCEWRLEEMQDTHCVKTVDPDPRWQGSIQPSADYFCPLLKQAEQFWARSHSKGAFWELWFMWIYFFAFQKEFAIPEQFRSFWNGKKLMTEVSDMNLSGWRFHTASHRRMFGEQLIASKLTCLSVCF